MSVVENPPPQNDWAVIQLPDTWADRAVISNPLRWFNVLGNFWRASTQKVRLPAGVPGEEWIPPYVLQPFHSLPNGNYSKYISRGYITGFDRAMLGEMKKARQQLAYYFANCSAVLDAGCGGGRMGAAIQHVGVKEVWGLDPSPYLLQHAAKEYPHIHFVQGLVEDMQFEECKFDGVVVCFLFHEMPPKYIRKALSEIYRVMQPGGVLAVCEPSRVQLELTSYQLFKQYGWRGVYFKILAKYIHEPFLQAWHKLNLQTLFTEAGFELVHLEQSMPVTCILSRKPLHPSAA